MSISTNNSSNNLRMSSNTDSIITTSSSLSTNNCAESTFTHLFNHQSHHNTDPQSTQTSIQTQQLAHYQSAINTSQPIALQTSTTLNANSSFYSPHFTMQQFSPIANSTSFVAASSALSSNNGISPSIGILPPSSFCCKLPSNNSFCTEDNSAFMEPQQSVVLSGSEETSVNSSGSGSLASSNCSAVSSCSIDNATSSSSSINSLTSSSQNDLYQSNSSYLGYRQNDIKPETNINYNKNYLHAFSESDIALATKPGSQIYFDPSVCHFSDEELRPQPMNKKSRKQNVPDCLKDEKYWARRAKNNVAAKKSREQRRLKENQVLLRASYLEKQNQALRVELQLLRCEHAKLANYLPQ